MTSDGVFIQLKEKHRRRENRPDERTWNDEIHL
jgi:hypothetical protein